MTVIAMTREIGSHGSDVAAGVAAELGLEIINSEIDTRKLSQYTLDRVLDLALKDNVLIRGWGAAALFQGIRGIMCVRVCAPMAARVHVMRERLGVNDSEAIQREIERFDAGHSRAMRAAFNFDWTDALLYDIVLNSARVTIDDCVKAVCQLAKHQGSQDDSAAKAALAKRLQEIKAGEIAAPADHTPHD
jgi:cytidylate kinase